MADALTTSPPPPGGLATQKPAKAKPARLPLRRRVVGAVRRRFMQEDDYLLWCMERLREDYDRDIARAAARGDTDEVEGLRHEARFEVGQLSSERDHALTRRYLGEAERLMVPVPGVPECHEEEEVETRWRWDDSLGRRVLTAEGISAVRSAIRAELKERRDAGNSRLALWVGLGGVLIGVINALVALVKLLL